MSNRSAPNLLGCIEDRRAYGPPEAVHGANSEAAVVPSSSRHDNLSPVRKSCGQRRHCPYHPNLVIASLIAGELAAPPYIHTSPLINSEYRDRPKPQSRGRILGASCCGTQANPLQALTVLDQDKPLRPFSDALRAKCLVHQADNGECGTIIKVVQRCFLTDFLVGFLGLGGRPPLRFSRRACNCLKYSGPRLAISFPPFRPSLTAAGSFFFGKIQRV